MREHTEVLLMKLLNVFCMVLFLASSAQVYAQTAAEAAGAAGAAIKPEDSATATEAPPAADSPKAEIEKAKEEIKKENKTAASKADKAKTEKTEALANFKPGRYLLLNGQDDLCGGSGQFYLRDHGTNLALGDLHGFNTKPSEETLPSDAPGDEGCVYKATDGVDVKGDQTTLTFHEIRTCNGNFTHDLKEVAVVQSSGRIELNVEQTGAPAFKYFCVWQRK